MKWLNQIFIMKATQFIALTFILLTTFSTFSAQGQDGHVSFQVRAMRSSRELKAPGNVLSKWRLLKVMLMLFAVFTNTQAKACDYSGRKM